MPLTRVQCPECRTPYHVEAQNLGRVSKCRACGKTFRAVASETTPPAPARKVGPDSQPDQLGRFVIREQVGAGGFGTVYRAYDPTLDREIALKVPRSGTLRDPKSLERFLREARSSAPLRHAHIVPVYDAGVFDGTPYIASAFIEGHTLSRSIEDGPLEPREAARIILDLTDAVHTAHAVGIIHRDIKPSNVMVDTKGHVLLTDFGLARRAQEAEKLTTEGVIVGTPAYMAPELISNHGEADAGTDQYALGATLYELLCGQTPFSGPSAIVLFNAIHTPPPPPDGINPRVPAELGAICLKTLAKNPKDRYPDCLALAEDLRQWIQGAVGKLSVPNSADIESAAAASYFGQTLDTSPAKPASPRQTSKVRTLKVLTAAVGTIVVGLPIAYFVSRPQREETAASTPPSTSDRTSATPAVKDEPKHSVQTAVIDAPPLTTDGADKSSKPMDEQAKPSGEANEAVVGASTESSPPAALVGGMDPQNDPTASSATASKPALPVVRIPQSKILEYAAKITEAYQACQRKETTEAQQRLEECPEALRGWEWGFCYRLTGSRPPARQVKAKTLKNSFNTNIQECLVLRTGNTVNSFVFAPVTRSAPTSQGLIAECGPPNRPTLGYWKLPNGVGPAYDSVPAQILDMAFSPDGTSLALASGSTVILRNVESGSTVRRFTNSSDPTGGSRLVFSDDGRWIAMSNGGLPIPVWSVVGTGGRSAILHGPVARVSCLAFSPNHDSLVVGTAEGKLIQWEVLSDRIIGQVSAVETAIVWLGFHKNGVGFSLIARDGGVQIRATPTAAVLFSYQLKGHDGPIISAAISPDGGRIVTGGEDKTVRVWETESGQLLLTLKGHADTVKQVAFSPDGLAIASTSYDNTIRIWYASPPPTAPNGAPPN